MTPHLEVTFQEVVPPSTPTTIFEVSIQEEVLEQQTPVQEVLEQQTLVHLPHHAEVNQTQLMPTTTPLFVPVQAPLVEAPTSTPPRRPATRRKTLAGVSSFAGFPM